MKVGDKAGLSLFQHLWGAISLQRTDAGFDIVLDQPPVDIKDRHVTFIGKSSRYSKPCTREVLRRKVAGSTIYDSSTSNYYDYVRIDLSGPSSHATLRVLQGKSPSGRPPRGVRCRLEHFDDGQAAGGKGD